MKAYSLADQSIALLNKALDLHAEKERIIASNVANAETPGYAPAKYDFQKQLKQAVAAGDFTLQTTHSHHIPLSPHSIEGVQGVITKKVDTTGIGDQNGVSLEEEMLDLSENQLRYETSALLLKKKLSIQKYVITGGGQ